jgi:hypothetical protein
MQDMWSQAWAVLCVVQGGGFLQSILRLCDDLHGAVVAIANSCMSALTLAIRVVNVYCVSKQRSEVMVVQVNPEYTVQLTTQKSVSMTPGRRWALQILWFYRIFVTIFHSLPLVFWLEIMHQSLISDESVAIEFVAIKFISEQELLTDAQ